VNHRRGIVELPTDNFRGLAARLDVLIRLTAVSILGEKTGGEAIDFLARAGLDNETIADLVGTTKETVRVRRWKTAQKGSPAPKPSKA
jgi:hypothetical protein